MSIFVTDVWVIPALPLLAFLLNILVIRPLDVATRDRGHAAQAQGAHGHDEAHGATGAPEHHEGEVSADDAYVRAMDTVDGHIDTQAAMPRALRKATTTPGGQNFVALMEDEEAHPHHPHGQPTIFARLNGFITIAFMAAAFAWSLGVLFALINNPALQK